LKNLDRQKEFSWWGDHISVLKHH